MKKPRSRLRTILEYAFIRTLALILLVLPLRAAVALGRCITRLLGWIDRRHSRLALEAARDRLNLPEPEAARLVSRMYGHLGTMLAEFPRQSRLAPDNVDSFVDWGDIGETLAPLFAEGRGIIFTTGHIANWELTGQAYTAKGYLHGSVARPLDNPLLDAWILRMRQARGQVIWDKWGALRSALRALRNNQGCGFLVDQNGGEDGVETVFFGSRCSSMAAPADLALRTGAPIVPAALVRVAPMRFRAVWRTPVRANPEAADPAAERARIVQEYTAALESIIREAPEQWLWMHRRWKPKKSWQSGGNSGK